MKIVYICSDSVAGICSAIYDAWKISSNISSNISSSNMETAGIAILGKMEQELFCEYIESKEEDRKVRAVIKLIKDHLGEEVYLQIYQALLSTDGDKGNAILGTMLEARNIPKSHAIMDHLSNCNVMKVFQLSRNVGHEAHQFTGFVRFRELESGVLFSEIRPKNQILTCIADHFEDRLPLENWMIYDKTNHLFLVHQANKHWVLVSGDMQNEDAIGKISDREIQYQELWKGFCKSISIENRKSLLRQKQHLPIRYRQDMVEFQ